MWQISDMSKGRIHWEWPIVWKRAYRGKEDDEESNLYQYPLDVKEAYLRLSGKEEFDKGWDETTVPNVVELIQDEDADCAFDQPCKYGHRVEGHAVYCHNRGWEFAPRKCRRTWYTGGKVRDEDCMGFKTNPNV